MGICMLRTTVVLLVIALQLAQAPAGSSKLETGNSQRGSSQSGNSLAAAVDTIVQEAMRDGRTPGVSVVVARGGRIVYTKGYGLANVELNVPATPDAVYRIGSITKQFTAAAIMQLVEQGKMSLDDPIEKFLPDFPGRGRHLTIRHLLNHTSGI